MRTSTLKKLDLLDPAGAGSPDPVLYSDRAAAQPPAASRPLSTFISDETGGTGLLRQRVLAYGMAALLETLSLAAIWVALEYQPNRQPDRESAAIEMVQALPQPQPTPPKLKKIELPTLKPEQLRSLPRMRLALDRMLPIPAPQDALPVSQPPPPPSPPRAASAEAADRFQAEVRAAIQAAVVYPRAARMMKQQGRAKVAFVLNQSHATAPRIIQSSGNAAIDAAALAAVRDAAYPAPPPEMAGKPLSFAVFVVFSLSSG